MNFFFPNQIKSLIYYLLNNNDNDNNNNIYYLSIYLKKKSLLKSQPCRGYQGFPGSYPEFHNF